MQIFDRPEGIHQLQYAGGGHPGCGGVMEALEVETMQGPIFLLHEYRTESQMYGERYRWRQFEHGGDALANFDKACWPGDGTGFTPWNDKPFWEAVDYNPPPPQKDAP